MKECKMVIDTIAINSDINNFNDFTIVNKDNFDYVERLGEIIDNRTQKLSMRVKINLHTKYGHTTINSTKKHSEYLENALNELGIVELREVTMERIDIAIDTNDIDFKNDFKKLLFAFELLTIKHKRNARWYTTNLNSLQNNSIKLHDSRFELEIYDKGLESNNVYPYKTRLEMRYKRLNKGVGDTDIYINKTLEKINQMDGHLETLEMNMANRLITLWELEQGKIKSFSEFVRKYNDYFYTLNILKVVYKASGLKGSYSKWLEKFRITNKLEFYTKSDIKQMQKAMIKSIKNYNKN